MYIPGKYNSRAKSKLINSNFLPQSLLVAMHFCTGKNLHRQRYPAVTTATAAVCHLLPHCTHIAIWAS